MSPPIYMRLVETLMNEYGYDYDSTPGVIEKYDLMFDPGNIVNVPEGPFNDDQFATGGRVGLQEGGDPEQFKDVLGSFGIDRGDLTMSNLPGFGMQLLDAFTPNALVKFLRENFGIESTEEEAQRLMEEQGFETGGRVGLQTGGLPIRTGDFRDSNNDGIDDRDQPEIFGGSGIGNIKKFSPETYEQILSRIEQTYPTDSQQTISRPGPQAEALQSVFGPTLAQFLGRPMSPTGGTNVFGEQFGSFLPQQQAQNRLQQLQIEQALGQAGLGRAQFDPRTGGLTGVTGTGTGVAGFQPFLDQATTTADRASQEAVAGQDAGLQQLQNAATQANLAGLAAIAGQDSGARGVGAAQNIADRIEAQAVAGQDRAQPFLDRAAQLSAPGAFEEFMSPYQQEVLDTTRQELERQLQQQQAQLGASAGAAFGGGRFGVAQGELGARGATGIASTLAGLRQTGFQRAQDSAARALGQQLQLGQAAQGQAGQNLGLLGQALQGQLAGAGGAQAQAGQNVNLLGASGGQQIQAGTSLGAQAGQDLGLLGQATGLQTGLATLQPQLAAGTIGTLGQLGTQQQAIGQAGLDTIAQGQQMIATGPMQQLGFFGSQLPAFTGGTTYMPQGAMGPGPSPLSQVLGGIAGIGGTALSLGSLFR